MTKQPFDYIVVGGGTTGSVVAARLAQQPKQRVALVEAGPSDEDDQRLQQLHQWPTLFASELASHYAIEPQKRGNSRLKYASSKVLGGSSSLSPAIALIPPNSDFARWHATGVKGWKAATLRPFYERVTQTLSIETTERVDECTQAFVKAARQIGFTPHHFNQTLLQKGVGLFPLHKQGHQRHSSSAAYLHPLSQWGEALTLFTHTVAHHILFDQNNRALGVQTSQGPIYCDKEIIICAGAIGSAKLLLLSGIGPAKHLKKMGIDVHVNRPGVGQHLQDHPQGVIVWEASKPLPNITGQYLEAGLFEQTEDNRTAPNLLLRFGTLPFDTYITAYGYPQVDNGFSITLIVTRPKSYGQLYLRSADPIEPPRLDFNYFTDIKGHDEKVMIAGLHLARRLAKQAALKQWIQREVAPSSSVGSRAGLSKYLRLTGGSAYHATSSCKMGPDDDEMSVVNGRLQLIGTQGVRVADASIFPTITTVDPALTCMMIGERCADFIINPTHEPTNHQ